MPGLTRVRARRGEGERLHDEIVAAATRLLIEKGDADAVSIRAIADAVGVTPPSIYLHFADKDELIVAVCASRFEEIDRQMAAAVAGVTDPILELRKRGEAYVRFGLSNPEEYRVLFMLLDKPTSDPEKVTQWACLQHMVDNVRRCMEAGRIREGDAFLTTIGLWASAHGITSLLISKPAFPWPPLETLIDHVLSTVITGLRA